MRRIYAFEAEGVSDEVKAQLEKVEDVVDEKCTTEEACDKMLDKIDAEADKFNGALTEMKDAAQDCKDGKCDQGEMAEKIAPKMAELKEVAKAIGVATEGDTVTQAELKDAKDYLEGAREIVESKKDEVSGDSKSDDKGDGECDHEDKDGDGECDKCGEELSEEDEEANEAFYSTCEVAIEGWCLDVAMEGANIDAVAAYKAKCKAVREARSAMNKAAKDGDFKEAASKAREAAAAADSMASTIDGLSQSVTSAVLVDLALMLTAIVVAAGTGVAIGRVRGAKAGADAAARAGVKQAVKSGAVGAAAGRAGDATYAQQMALGKGTMASRELAEQAVKDEKVRFLSKVAKDSAHAGAKTGATHGALVGAGVGAGAGAGAAALASGGIATVALLKRKDVMDGEGNVSKEKLQPNDINPLIMAMKADARLTKKRYEKLAADYDKQASSATESFVSDEELRAAAESFSLFERDTEDDAAMEGLVAILKARKSNKLARIQDFNNASEVIRVLTSAASDNGCELAKDEEAKQMLDALLEQYEKYPGKINKTKSELTTVNGYPVIISRNVDKEGNPKAGMANLYSYIVIKDGKHIEDVLSRGQFEKAYGKNWAHKDEAPAEGASESMGVDFDGFMAACESTMIGRNSNGNAPYLFD